MMARRTKVAMAPELVKPVLGAAWRRNRRRHGRRGTPALKIADDCFSNVGRQGHLSPVPAFAAEGDAAVLPVDVIEGQPHDLIGTEAQPGEQQQDGVIPHAGRHCSDRTGPALGELGLQKGTSG